MTDQTNTPVDPASTDLPPADHVRGVDPLRGHADVGPTEAFEVKADDLGVDNIDGTVQHAALYGETADRILTPEISQRFTDARVHAPAVREAVIEELAKGRTEDEVRSDIESDLAQFEKNKAAQDAKQAEDDARFAAQSRRVERLTTASIILPHLIANAEKNVGRKVLVNDALGFADLLIDAVAIPDEA